MSQKSVIGWSCLYCGFLACVSVAHWLVTPSGVSGDYRNVYHMISGIQGFLSGLIIVSCFLFLPGKYGRRSPGKILWLAAFLTPVGTSAAAWFRFAVRDEIMLAISMVFWTILVCSLLAYCYPLLKTRYAASARTSIFWFCCALIFGGAGTCLVSTYSTINIVTVNDIPWILFLGRGYLLQGMFLSVFFAVVPAVVNKLSNNSDNQPLHVFNMLGALVLVLSIPVEFWISTRLGFALRVSALLLVFGNQKILKKPPRIENRLLLLIWLSIWTIPVGYMVPVIAPELRETGLHIVLITGITLGLLTIVLNSIQEHVRSRVHPIPLLGFLAAFIIAVIIRSCGELDTERQVLFLSISAFIFVFGIILWLVTVFDVLISKKH